jgi:hypothetical protein
MIVESSKDEDRVALIHAIRNSLDRNLKLIKDISLTIGKIDMIEERFELVTLESISDYKYGFLKLNTCIAVDEAVHHLRWYSEKYETLREWVVENTRDDGFTIDAPYGIGFSRGSLAGHRGVVEDHIKKAINLLDVEIQQAGGSPPNKANSADAKSRAAD